MFCPEGYTLLSEINRQFEWDSDLLSPNGVQYRGFNSEEDDKPDFENIVGYNAFQFWLHIGLSVSLGNEMRVCLLSGAVARLHHHVFSIDVSDGFARHRLDKSLFEFPKGYEKRKALAECSFSDVDHIKGVIRPGPFSATMKHLENLPVCIKDSSLPVALKDISRWVVEELARLNRREGPYRKRALCGQDILTAFEDGRVKTKAEAKALFGQDLKHEAWLAVWREATQLDPSLSRPGPKS